MIKMLVFSRKVGRSYKVLLTIKARTSPLAGSSSAATARALASDDQSRRRTTTISENHLTCCVSGIELELVIEDTMFLDCLTGCLMTDDPR